MISVFQVEIDFAGHPVFVALGQKGRDETQAGRGVVEDRCHTRAALDLAIDSFETVGGAQTNPLAKRHVERREALREVLLGPLGQLGRIGGPELEGPLHQALSLDPVRCIEDRPNALRHGFALIETGDIRLSVLLQMKLAALPGPTGQGRAAGRIESGMSVGDDPLDAPEAAPDQTVEKGPPMDLRLGQGHRHAEYPSMAILRDAGRYEMPAWLGHPWRGKYGTWRQSSQNDRVR